MAQARPSRSRLATMAVLAFGLLLAFGLTGCDSHDDDARALANELQGKYAEIAVIDLASPDVDHAAVIEEMASLASWKNEIDGDALTYRNGSTELRDNLCSLVESRMQADSAWVLQDYERLMGETAFDPESVDAEAIGTLRAQLEALQTLINEDQLAELMLDDDAFRASLADLQTRIVQRFEDFATQETTLATRAASKSASSGSSGSYSGSSGGEGFGRGGVLGTGVPYDSEYASAVDGSGYMDAAGNYWYSDAEKMRIADIQAQQLGYRNHEEYIKDSQRKAEEYLAQGLNSDGTPRN